MLTVIENYIYDKKQLVRSGVSKFFLATDGLIFIKIVSEHVDIFTPRQ